MAEVRGIVVNAMTTFLVARYGKGGVDEAIAALDPKDAALVQKRFLDGSFYPYVTIIALRRLARALSSRKAITGDELGAFMAEHVFQGVYKPLLASDAPKMVEKIAWLKDFFYRDTDRIAGAMSGDHSCNLTYRYEEGIRPTRGTCRSLMGFWGRALEMAGHRKVSSLHPVCIAEGADRCEFQFSW